MAAHSLYEQPDPNCFYEPEGKIDMSAATFEPEGERGIRVAGTRLIPANRHTVKLEGAAPRGYRAVTLAGVRDPEVIRHLDDIETGVRAAVTDALRGVLAESDMSLRFLRYGLDGVMGSIERDPPPPREVGLVIEAVAPTQDLADTALSLARSTAPASAFRGPQDHGRQPGVPLLAVGHAGRRGV